MTELVISARSINKHFNGFQALKNVSFEVPKGRILGVIGANGAGKTTLLNAVLGLSSCDGNLNVLGLDPMKSRDELMQDVCFIADVATLPKWMKVSDLLDYVERVHPKFHRSRALEFIARTTVPLDKKIGKLSKGMTVQVHLAVIMAIDAKLLVLDEPTLGLDILFRKEFYKSLLEEYFDEERTIIITTHQVEEIEHILTDVIFIQDGEIVLSDDLDNLSEQFVEIDVTQGKEELALALNPIAKQSRFGRLQCVFYGVDSRQLEPLGNVGRLGLADIFVTIMKNKGLVGDKLQDNLNTDFSEKGVGQ